MFLWFLLSVDGQYISKGYEKDVRSGGGSSAEPCLTEWDGFIIRTSESIQNGAEFIDAQNKISDEVKSEKPRSSASRIISNKFTCGQITHFLVG